MAVIWCLDPRHDDPCPQAEDLRCTACEEECDSTLLVYRFVVGKTGESERIGSYETMEQVHAWQTTLPPDELARGDYYIDDMASPDAPYNSP